MRKLVAFICFLFLIISFQKIFSQQLSEYVNPLIGTKGLFLYGRTTPFVTPPFGMTHWTPVTRKSHIAVPLYNYFDTRIRGFRASHKPAMWMGDYGHVTLKPVIGKLKSKTLKRSYYFSHCSEKSKPYYYSVKLHTQKLSKIKTEMTATARCGMLKFTFPKTKSLLFLLKQANETIPPAG